MNDFIVEKHSASFGGTIIRVFTPDPKVRVGTAFQSVGREVWFFGEDTYTTEAAAIAAIIDQYIRIAVAGGGNV